MFVISNLFNALALVIDIVLEIYKWIIIIRAIISWVNPDPYNPIVRFLYTVTEPVLKPIRKAIGYRLGPIDISPLIVILAIIFLQYFVVTSLKNLAITLR